LLQPETGDDLQWEKAGLLEVADIVVIHKADLPGAESAAAQVRAALDLAGAKPIPVLRVSAKTGEGIDELVAAIAACPPKQPAAAALDRSLVRLVQETVVARLAQAEAAGDAQVQQLAAAWRRGELDSSTAGAALLRLLAGQNGQEKK